MKDLIEIKSGRIFTTSNIFAEEFKIENKHVMENIRNLTAEYPTVKKEFRASTFINTRNREYENFEMTRDGFMFLIMNMGGAKTHEARQLIFTKQKSFIDGFNIMEQVLLNQHNNEWLNAREQGKLARKETTNAVKLLLNYISKNYPDSTYNKKPRLAYSNYTKATHKALELLEHNKPKTRDTLNLLELNQLYLAEDVVAKTIINGVNNNDHYKEIFINAKEALENFASAVYVGNKTNLALEEVA